MAIIHVNEKIKNREEAWKASNGKTRPTLVVVNKAGVEGKTFRASLGTLHKGNHSFIFINEEKKPDDRVLGIFLNSHCGYAVVEEHSPEGAEIFSGSSEGGPKNSESKFGIYKLGTTIEVFSYANRGGETFFRLTEEGWECLGSDIPLSEEEITEV